MKEKNKSRNVQNLEKDARTKEMMVLTKRG